MLPKEYRLNQDQEIRNVFKNGRGAYSRLLGVKFLPNKLKNNRFCFVISNKISKKSSKRNLLKRRLRDYIHLNLAKFKGNFDIVVSVRPGSDILDKKYEDLAKDLEWTVKKAGLLR